MLAKFFKECSVHPEEPIIRASFDLKNAKLLYCHECLTGVNNNVKSGLINAAHIENKLYEQLVESRKDLPDTDFNQYTINKSECVEKIEELIKTEKTKIDEEYTKIQNELLEILSASKNDLYAVLDKAKGNLLTSCDTYVEKLKNIIELSSSRDKEITKDDIIKEFRGSEEDAKAIEKNLKSRLEAIKTFGEIKGGTTNTFLETEKSKLKKNMELFNLCSPKETSYYKTALEELKAYLQALAMENLARKNTEKSADLLPGVSDMLGKLDQSVQASKSSLKKTEDQVKVFVESISGFSHTESGTSPTKVQINPQLPMPSAIHVSPSTQNRNLCYDEDIEVEDDEQLSEVESGEEENSRSRSRSLIRSQSQRRRIRVRSYSRSRSHSQSGSSNIEGSDL